MRLSPPLSLVTPFVVVGGYLLGSFLPAEWIVRWRTGRTPQEWGDNPGAAGTWRLAGLRAALAVGVLDVVKGALPVALALWLGVRGSWLTAAAVAPVAGHNWPVYRAFRGGRGLAPATGVLLVLAPRQVLPAYLLGFAAATLLRWRWVPIVGVVAFPVGLLLMWRARVPRERVQAAAAAMLAVIVSNLPSFWRRLTGTGRS